jgi:RNA polymerase sigma-70 factor (ECF subfamily)
MEHTSNGMGGSCGMEQDGRPFVSEEMQGERSGQRAGAFATRRRDWLLAQARRLCRDVNDAEDLVQETLLRFIQAFEQVETTPGEHLWDSWLVTTLTNLFYDQCRRRQVRTRGAKEASPAPEAVEARAPEDRPVYDLLTDEQFAQAVHALSPKLRATFELHAAGRKYEEIARVLDIGVGTVAKRLHDARAKLRELLLPHTGAGMH